MSFVPGGSGSSQISSSNDVVISNLSNKDVLWYDSTAAKWKNNSVVTNLQKSVPVAFATISDAQTAGANGQLIIGQLVVVG